MINAYKQGKDLYATIASGVYNNEYRLNLEYMTNPDGSPILDDSGERILYLEGKKRRSNCKKLLLGGPKVMPICVNSITQRCLNNN